MQSQDPRRMTGFYPPPAMNRRSGQVPERDSSLYSSERDRRPPLSEEYPADLDSDRPFYSNQAPLSGQPLYSNQAPPSGQFSQDYGGQPQTPRMYWQSGLAEPSALSPPPPKMDDGRSIVSGSDDWEGRAAPVRRGLTKRVKLVRGHFIVNLPVPLAIRNAVEPRWVPPLDAYVHRICLT